MWNHIPVCPSGTGAGKRGPMSGGHLRCIWRLMLKPHVNWREQAFDAQSDGDQIKHTVTCWNDMIMIHEEMLQKIPKNPNNWPLYVPFGSAFRHWRYLLELGFQCFGSFGQMMLHSIYFFKNVPKEMKDGAWMEGSRTWLSPKNGGHVLPDILHLSKQIFCASSTKLPHFLHVQTKPNVGDLSLNPIRCYFFAWT